MDNIDLFLIYQQLKSLLKKLMVQLQTIVLKAILNNKN